MPPESTRHADRPANRYLTSLSLWEIAHRWLGHDPEETDPHRLPVPIRDRMRDLMLAVHVYLNPYDAHDEEIPVEQLGLLGLRPTAFARKLEVDLKARTYDKAFLNSIYLRQDELAQWCEGSAIELPEFWFEPWELDQRHPQQIGDPAGRQKLTESFTPQQQDKRLCQQAGTKVWERNPNMTIAAACRCDEVQLAGGKNYTEKTLRAWLGEVAPLHVKGKRGRPKKSDS